LTFLIETLKIVSMKLKLALFIFSVVLGFSLLRPAPVLCVYCQGGTPCFSNVDCYLGCQCQAPPYMQGICVPKY